MHLKSFRRWVQQVYATRDTELDCMQFFNAVPRYVDMEVAGEEASHRYPNVKIHMDQCAECNDLYITVRDAASLELEELSSRLVID